MMYDDRHYMVTISVPEGGEITTDEIRTALYRGVEAIDSADAISVTTAGADVTGLRDDIRDALQGDSNVALQNALWRVAEVLGIDWQ